VHHQVISIGSLFSGYGGLDMAVPGEVAWYSEIEPAACKVLAAHHPNVPNLGDVKKIDWANVPRVDILTGGYPCQPFSSAGNRKGKEDERHLWPYVKDAISVLRPRIAILENVRGHLSLGLADVIGDLASVGYDARWGLVRASDAGATHNRARVFIVAYPAGQGLQRPDTWYAARAGSGKSSAGYSPIADTSSERHGQGQNFGVVGRMGTASEVSGREASTSRQESCDRSDEVTSDTESNEQRESAELGQIWSQSWHGNNGRSEQFTSDTTGGTRSEPGNQDEDRPSGGCEQPRERVSANSSVGNADSSNVREIREVQKSRNESGGISAVNWGQFEPAIRRWESVLGRQSPAPSVLSANGKPRLNPIFVEWMMGLPVGHVTGHSLSSAQELKMLGNGVCPQQAVRALQLLGVM
jgi:DNA (cytosine-5)-methyltransferase 1